MNKPKKSRILQGLEKINDGETKKKKSIDSDNDRNDQKMKKAISNVFVDTIESNSKLAEVNENNCSLSADDYNRYDQIDHIYQITDTYIGSDQKSERKERVLDLENKVFIDQKIELPEGVERLQIEILSNAGDNAERSIRQGIDPGTIEVTMDKQWIVVKNGGLPIPVKLNEKEGVYAPEMIMGILLTSSNYKKDKDRTGCGRNGYGAKLTNIFSKEFIVEVGDPVNKLYYRQRWTNNMKTREEPLIEKYTGKSFVQVAYHLDFERFGYTEYPDEAFNLYGRHAVDISFTCKVPVIFNGHKFNVLKIKDYAKLYMGNANNKSLIFYDWPEDTETITNKKGVKLAVESHIIPTIELCAIDTPDKGTLVAFANGMMNKTGGTHAESAFKAVSKSILKKVNKKDDEKNKLNGVLKLGVNDIKKHVTIIVSVRVNNPTFKGQYKEQLTGPKININIPEQILSGMMKWDLVERLYSEIDAKMFKNSKKHDGKKKRFVNVIKYEAANKAGTKESRECTLCLAEGDSAATYIDTMIAAYGDYGRDYYGSFPLKGKPLNVRNAPFEKLHNNQEINNLKKILGLRTDVDYTDETEFDTLNYGNVLIMADSDVDGKHIVGLIIDMFEVLFPSLLKRGYLKYVRTPIIRGTKGKKEVKFFTQHEFEEWLKTNSPKGWFFRYLKGLGSSTDEDIVDDCKERRDVNCVYDELAPTTLDLVFNGEKSEHRKRWLESYEPNYAVEEMVDQPISLFLNHEFIHFSFSDVKRSLPSFIDGLKVSQRKIVYGALKKWGKTIGTSKCLPLKVARLSTSIAEISNYHHNEKAIAQTIIGMAQEFVGTNNLPFFMRDGQFGNRKGRKPADPRYSATRPDWWWPYVFKEEDESLYVYVEDEGIKGEPENFFPIFPLHLINGCIGIGTAHSTWIPSHNPLDIANWFIAKIESKPLPIIMPWFRDFVGDVYVARRSRRKNPNYLPKEKDEDDSFEDPFEDEELVEDPKNLSLITIGKFEVSGKKRKTVTITELPVGRLSLQYKSWLDKMVEDKTISGYNNYCKKNTIKFEIFGMKNPSIQSLHLQRSFGLSNLVVLGEKDKPIKFATVLDMMEAFYEMRLKLYQRRKENILTALNSEIELLNKKLAFIKDYLDRKIIINNEITEEDLFKQMDKLGHDHSLATDVTVLGMTSTRMNKLSQQIEKIKQEHDTVEKISASTLWLNDINSFIQAYKKHYKN